MVNSGHKASVYGNFPTLGWVMRGTGAGLSDPCRTRETMRWQSLDNASLRLSDPCETSATLLWVRPSHTRKRRGSGMDVVEQPHGRGALLG